MGDSGKAWRLHWAVRGSFREYVAAISDNEMVLAPDTVLDDEARIVFPAEPGLDVDPQLLPEVIKFGGAVTFSAYRGVLTVRVREPWIHLPTADAEGKITVQHPAYRDETEVRVAIGLFDQIVPEPDRIVVDGIRMTEHAVRMLGDVYAIGAPLEPLEVIRSL